MIQCRLSRSQLITKFLQLPPAGFPGKAKVGTQSVQQFPILGLVALATINPILPAFPSAPLEAFAATNGGANGTVGAAGGAGGGAGTSPSTLSRLDLRSVEDAGAEPDLRGFQTWSTAKGWEKQRACWNILKEYERTTTVYYMTGRFYKLCVYPLGGLFYKEHLPTVKWFQVLRPKQQRIEADLTVAKKSSCCWFWRFLCCLNGWQRNWTKELEHNLFAHKPCLPLISYRKEFCNSIHSIPLS